MAKAIGARQLGGKDIGARQSAALAGLEYTFAMAAGSFTQTGVSAAFPLNRSFGLGSGSFSVSGEGLKITRALIARLAAGDLDVTGDDLALKRSITAALTSGGFSLTGEDLDIVTRVIRTVAMRSGATEASITSGTTSLTNSNKGITEA